jgi:hypothetical protein
MYENVIKGFEDTIEVKHPFNSTSFTKALSDVQNSTSFLKILMGEPGSGKTFFIHHYTSNINTKAHILKGNISKEELDEFLSQNIYDFIIIDEAQLLNNGLIEHIRILTDEKKYKFLLSMHTKEAKEIMQKAHFKSRNIDIIQMMPLSKTEMIQYINIKLIAYKFTHILNTKQFNKIYNYTNGNFRYIKKFIKTLFELMEFAHQNKLKKYYKINNCLLDMCAIELGFLDD